MTQQKESNCRVKVPAKEESRVVEVSLKQVILGVTILFTAVFVTTTGVILVREQARFKRQQAILDSTLKLVGTFNRKEKNVQE